jgi:AraC-like DNA-binding protein
MTIKHPDLALASGDYLSVVRDFAMSRGIQPATLLEGSELSINEFIHPPEFISNFLINKIGVNLYTHLENPLAEAVLYGLQVTSSSHGSLGVAIQCSETLREGLQVLEKFYNTRLASQDPDIRYDADSIHIQLVYKPDLLDHTENIQRFFDLSTLVSIARNVLVALSLPESNQSMTIYIDHKEPENFPFESVPYVKFEFDAPALKLKLPARWLDSPLSSANSALAKAALENCEKELRRIKPIDLVEKVRKTLGEVSGQIPGIEEIAAQHFMSTATLKRKLAKQGVSYLDLKNEVRLSKAEQLLTNSDQSLESIADQLGFNDPSNFSKFFKNLRGITPRAYREQNSQNID